MAAAMTLLRYLVALRAGQGLANAPVSDDDPGLRYINVANQLSL
jgi:hypothetical protein